MFFSESVATKKVAYGDALDLMIEYYIVATKDGRVRCCI